MTRWMGLAVAAALGCASAAAYAQGGAQSASVTAHAVIKGEGISGTAEFTEMTEGTGKEVVVTVSVKGLKPGWSLRSGSGQQHRSRCQSPLSHG